MQNEIKSLLFQRNADIVRYVDISGLGPDQTQGFSKAIVFCMGLSKKFVMATRHGVALEQNETIDKEHEADGMQIGLHVPLAGHAHLYYHKSLYYWGGSS